MSEQRIKYLLEHPENHPNRKIWNTKKNMTYPEQLVYGWLLQSNIYFIPQFSCKYTQLDGSIHTRYVDFYIPSKKLFIEIDGNYWHDNRKDIDLAKDKCAQYDGFKTFRIDTRKNVVEQISTFLK